MVLIAVVFLQSTDPSAGYFGLAVKQISHCKPSEEQPLVARGVLCAGKCGGLTNANTS